MADNVQELVVKEIGKFGEDFKALNDNTKRELTEMRAEIDAAGKSVDPLVTEKINKFAESVETKTLALEKGVKAVTEGLEKVEAVLKRPASEGWSGDDAAKEAKAAFDWAKARAVANGNLKANAKVDYDAKEVAEYNDAFKHYIRARSDGALKANFQAAMHTGSDPDGGYLVPTQVSTKIITKIYETSNMRGVANVETIGGKELEIPRDEGEFGFGGWVGEQTTPSETTTAQLGVSKIFAHEMYVEPRVTQNMLEDAGLDIEGWVANKVGEKMGRIEATAFYTGTGVNQPRGILTYGSGTTNGTIEQVISGHATQLTSDAFYNLVFQLKDYYTSNARFQMKRTTVRDAMKLKDGQNNYLWQMGDIKGGQPATILGFAVDRCEDMPVLAASSLSVAFGDFKAAYTIVDRLGIALLRDNLTAKPFVKFYNRRRVGGDVVNFEALKLMVTSA